MEACLTRFIRRDLEDASNDDQNSYEETQGLLNTLYINSIIFAVFMTFYEMNRHMRSIYLKRLTSKFKVDSSRPAQLRLSVTNFSQSLLCSRNQIGCLLLLVNTPLHGLLLYSASATTIYYVWSD